MPYFSVIVPTFNVGLYLRETLESLKAQTFQDYEIIIVNDGSTDDTLEIAQQYALQEDRVKVLNQANQGASVARNVGISNATGEYIYFLDGDDVIDEDALLKMHRELALTKADMYLFSAAIFGDMNSDLAKMENYARHVSFGLQDGAEYLLMCVGEKFSVSPCCYVTRRKTIDNISFIPHVNYEDNAFIYEILAKSGIKIVAKDDRLFKRRIRAGSVMTQPRSNMHYHSIVTVTKTIANIKFATLLKSDENKVKNWILGGLFGDVCFISFKLHSYLSYKIRFSNLMLFYYCIKIQGMKFFSLKRLVLSAMPELYRIKS